MNDCKFSWDEPAECASPRGWCHLDNHADEGRCPNVVGFYLDYGPKDYGVPRPDGDILASAYIFELNDIGHQSQTRLGYAWFRSIEDAKVFIESNINAYFGLERKPMHHEMVTVG